MKDKTYNATIFGYTDNHTRYKYKFGNTDTKSVIMARDIKWVEWKMTDPVETMKMFRDSNKNHLVPGIE